MRRVDTFGFRVDSEERSMITAIAQRLERPEGDAVRLIVREVARELGILPAAPARRERGERKRKKADVHAEHA